MLAIKYWKEGRLLLLLFLIVLVGCEPARLTPTPRPPPTATTPPLTPEPTAQALSGTSWLLVELNGKTDSALQGVTAHFDDAQLVGWTGCNSYAAQYKMGAGTIQVSDVLSTTAEPCTTEPTATLEREYLATLGQATTYQLQGADLKFNDGAGKGIVRYRALQAMQLSGASWVLSAYQNGEGQLVALVPASPAVTATFTGGALRGYGGCSNYEGSYTLVGTTVTIQGVKRVAVVSSDSRCAAGGELRSQEDAFLAALPQAQTASIEGSQLTLKNGQGEPVAVLTLVAIPG